MTTRKYTRKSKLTIKQKRFVDLLLTDPDMNQTKAFIAAGYSPTGADGNAAREIGKDSVQQYLQERMKERQKRLAKESAKLEKTQDDVARELIRMGFANLTDAVTWDKNGLKIKSSDDLPEFVRVAIAEIIEDKTELGAGVVKSRIKIKLHDKGKALVDYGKHIGMWPNKIQHNITNFTAADREGACLYELPVEEYVERKNAGTLPPIPEVPGPRVH